MPTSEVGDSPTAHIVSALLSASECIELEDPWLAHPSPYTPHDNTVFLSAKPMALPGLPQLCCTSPLRWSSWLSTPVLSLTSDLQSLSLRSQSPSTPNGMQTIISGYRVLVSIDFCVEFSILCLLQGFPVSSAGKESACNAGWIPVLGRSLGEGIG